MNFLTTVNLNSIPVQNLAIETFAELPAYGNYGRMVIVADKCYLDVGDKWLEFSQSGVVGSHNHPMSDITGLVSALADKADASHSHAISDITNLQTTLNGKAASSHSHAISDITNLQSSLDGKASTSHTHGVSDVTGLQSALDGKASTSHTHTIANITNLQTTLDGKAATSHNHTASNITDFDTSVDNRIVAYFDTVAGADNDLDTLREIIDRVINNTSALEAVIKRFNADIGDGSSTEISVTHNLASLDCTVEVYEKSTGETVFCGVTRTSSNVVKLTFVTAPTSSQYRVVIKV